MANPGSPRPAGRTKRILCWFLPSHGTSCVLLCTLCTSVYRMNKSVHSPRLAKSSNQSRIFSTEPGSPHRTHLRGQRHLSPHWHWAFQSSTPFQAPRTGPPLEPVGRSGWAPRGGSPYGTRSFSLGPEALDADSVAGDGLVNGQVAVEAALGPVGRIPGWPRLARFDGDDRWADARIASGTCRGKDGARAPFARPAFSTPWKRIFPICGWKEPKDP